MTALADLMASEAICVTASGRASKMTASRPSGQLTFSSSRPVVELGAIEHAADGVGQGGDGAHAGDHGRELVGGELQAIDQRCDEFAAAERPLAASACPAALAARISGAARSSPAATASSAWLRSSSEVEAMARAACLAASARARTACAHVRFPGEKSVPTGLPAQNACRGYRACGRWR